MWSAEIQTETLPIIVMSSLLKHVFPYVGPLFRAREGKVEREQTKRMTKSHGRIPNALARVQPCHAANSFLYRWKEGFSFAIAIMLMIIGAPSAAAEILHTTVTHENARYNVDFEVILDAPVERVRQHLTDYDKLARLSDTIVESRVLSREENRQRVFIMLRPCVLFFCRTIRRTVDVEFSPDGQVLSLADPKNSDFKYSLERWNIAAAEERTRLRYTAEVEPSFYVPPLIGPWFVKSTITTELQTTAKKLEALAHASE